MDITIPTWGYRPDGEAKIFDLDPGAALPEGWSLSPDVIIDPSFATADAVTARAAGRAYIPPAASGDDATSPTSEFEAAVAEIERLKGIIATGAEENAALIAEIETAEKVVEQAAADLATLRTALEAAETDKTAALAAADVLKADLDAARADLEALTAPKPAAAEKTSGKAK